MSKAKMRTCWNCGDEMGVIEDKYYDSRDTCGKIECERAAGEVHEIERSEAHEQLDRDNGWY